MGKAVALARELHTGWRLHATDASARVSSPLAAVCSAAAEERRTEPPTLLRSELARTAGIGAGQRKSSDDWTAPTPDTRTPERNDMQNEAHQLASGALTEALDGINTSEHPPYVAALVGDFRANVTEALASGSQLLADMAELKAKSDLLPEAGRARLSREAQAEAETRAKAALNTARTSAATLRRAALLEVQPQVSKERESLAREEFALVIGEGTPDQLALRVAKLAEDGSRDSLGVLNSSYGRTLLSARGMEGRDLEDALSSARRIIAESALEHGEARHTPSEIRAAKLYRSAADLEAVIGAASFALAHMGISHA